jgi:hypothetical protein
VPLKDAANVFTEAQEVIASGGIIISSNGDDPLVISQASTSELTKFDRSRESGNVRFELNPMPTDGTSLAEVRIGRTTNTSGQVKLSVFKGNNSAVTAHELFCNGTLQSNINGETLSATAWRYRGLTTGTGTDLVIDANGYILKKTSSLRYKTDIENMDIQFAEEVMDKIRPVFYRNKESGPTYPGDWSYWGVIAEELAAIDPRLVTWGYWPEDYEEVEKTVIEEDGIESKFTTRELKKDAKLSPTGVMYDRLSVIAIKAAQADRKRITDLETRLAKLEAKIK